MALFLLLVALILRPVAFAFRNKLENKTWLRFWEIIHFLSGFLPALLCGVAVGNTMLGTLFQINPDDMSIIYKGTFFELLNPYAILIGLISVSMIIMQGAVYLCMKTNGDIALRSAVISKFASISLIVLYILGGLYTMNIYGYVITTDIIWSVKPII
jgi:cytochrome d ubiquinol oxidase subunit II